MGWGKLNNITNLALGGIATKSLLFFSAFLYLLPKIEEGVLP